MEYLLFVVGLIAIGVGAHFLVEGASSLGKRLGMTNLIIGLTIVAFGTSAPELIINIFASIEEKTDLAISNVLGSNILNIYIIIGVTALIFPIHVKKSTINKDIPFSLLSTLILLFIVGDTFLFPNYYNKNSIDLKDGIFLLIMMGLFLYYSFLSTKKAKKIKKKEILKDETTHSKNKNSLLKDIIYILIGLAGLFFGGKWSVDNASIIASNFGLSDTIIGLTIVAIGTSLPELATSVVAAIKKNTDMAIGNAIGSSIFNIFLILGVSSVINPIPFDNKLYLDVGVVLLTNIFLIIFIFLGKERKISRFEGALLIVIYLVYISFSISNHL